MHYPGVLLQDCLAEMAKRNPHKEAVVCGTTRMNYEELNLNSGVLSSAFMRLGLKFGDRVIICLDNSVEAIISFWATLKAGAVACLLSPGSGVERLRYCMLDAEARLLVCDVEQADAIAREQTDFPLLSRIVVPAAPASRRWTANS